MTNRSAMPARLPEFGAGSKTMLRCCILVTMGLLTLTCLPARAVDRYWVGNSNFWDVPTSWSFTPGGLGGAGMPLDGDRAYVISSAFNVTVTRDEVTPSYTGAGPSFVMLDGSGGSSVTTLLQTANRMAADGERVGFNGRGQYIQIGGSNVVGNLWLGGNTGSAGTYSLSAAAASLTANFIDVAEANGAGTFNHNNGTVTTNALYVGGFGAPSRGTYNFANGALSASTLALGVAGIGTFVQTGGVASFTSALEINPGSRCTQNAGDMWVGNVVINGGRFDRAAGTTLNLTPGKSISIAGGGTMTQGGGFRLPNNSSMTITSGTYSTPNWLDIGNYENGSLTVDGATSSATTGAQSYWGLGTGHATITLSNGAQGTFGAVRLGTFGGAGSLQLFSNSTMRVAGLDVGADAGSRGVVTVDHSVLYCDGDLVLGNGGAGTLNMNGGFLGGSAYLQVNSGGVVDASAGAWVSASIRINPGGRMRANATLSNVFEVDGGTLDGSAAGISASSSQHILVTNNGSFALGLDQLVYEGSTFTVENGGALRIDKMLLHDFFQHTPKTLNVSAGRFEVGELEIISGDTPMVTNFSSGTIQVRGATGFSVGASGPLGNAFDLAAGKSLEIGHTTTIDSSGSIALNGGTFSTGSLTGGGSFIFNSGTFRITGSDLVLDGTGPIGIGLVVRSSSHAEVVGGHSAQITPNGELVMFGGSFNSEGGTVNNGLIFSSTNPADLFGNLTNGPNSNVKIVFNGNCTFHDDVVNQPGSYFLVNDSTATFLGNVTGASAFTGNGTLIFYGSVNSGSMNAGTTVVGSGGSLAVSAIQAPGLILQSGARAAILPSAPERSVGASRLNALVIAGANDHWTAKLDLANNDLLVDYTGESPINTIRNQIRSARHGGQWDGNGITSSPAQAASSHATTLGLLSGSEYLGIYGGSATFDGFPVDGSSALVKYTWYGDTDFNGLVNFDDYVRIDNGFNNHLSGWLNGDFDLNDVVNFDDYVLIDLAFNTQSGTLRRALSFADGSDRSLDMMDAPTLQIVRQHAAQFGEPYLQHLLAAVPEPRLWGVTAWPVLAFARRRARRT
jgi:T5SS/PEP-CTERM-associated repeat protein